MKHIKNFKDSLHDNLTSIWWNKCLNDKSKLEHWLVALYNNELDAYERFENFAKDYCLEDKKSYDIFMEIQSRSSSVPATIHNCFLHLPITFGCMRRFASMNFQINHDC